MEFWGEIAALSCAVMWASTAFVYTSASQYFTSFQMNAIRLISSTVFLAVFVFFFSMPIEMNFEQLILLVISGVVGMTLGDTFIFKGYQTIGPRLTALFLTLNPAVAAFIAFISIGEQLSFHAVVGISITIVGIIIVMFEKIDGKKQFSSISKKGILFCACASVFNGLQLVLQKQAFYISEMDALDVAFIRIFAASLFVYPAARLMGKYLKLKPAVMANPKTVRYLVVASFFGTVLGILFVYIAITNTDIGIASTLMSTTPIMMIPLARIITKEKAGLLSIIGAIIAVAGVSILFIG